MRAVPPLRRKASEGWEVSKDRKGGDRHAERVTVRVVAGHRAKIASIPVGAPGGRSAGFRRRAALRTLARLLANSRRRRLNGSLDDHRASATKGGIVPTASKA